MIFGFYGFLLTLEFHWTWQVHFEGHECYKRAAELQYTIVSIAFSVIPIKTLI